MAYKLKDLIITKVDFVDAGANQRANILLCKRAPEGGESKMTENKEQNTLQKFLLEIAKRLGFADEETAAAVDAVGRIEKADAKTFSETMAGEQTDHVCCEVWSTTDALACSLNSILRDDELDADQRREKMQQSLAEFSAMVGGFIPEWANIKPVGIKKREDAENLPEVEKSKKKSTKEGAEPEAPDVETDENGLPTESTPKKVDEEQKKKPCAKSAPAEEDKDMKINKSLLNEQEKAFLEEIEKKAGVKEEAPKAQQGEGVEKAAPAAEKEAELELADVMKSVPAVAEVLKALEDKVAKMEDMELQQVAKKYEILGINSEEMVTTLKSLKATPKAYDAVIKKFDAAVAAIEKSGVFEEIGKRGAEPTESGDAWARIEKHAEKLRAADPSLSYHTSIDKACIEHPELVHEYEG